MSERIRVLHLIGDPGPFGYPFFSLLGSHLDRDRFELQFATVEPAGWLQEYARTNGWKALSLDVTGRRGYPGAIARLTRYLRGEGIHVLHAHSLDASIVGLPAARAARRPVGVVTAHYPHETPFHDRRSLKLVDRLTLGGLAKAVVAPSRQMMNTLTEVLRVPARKVRVIEHGFELERFDPEGVDGRAMRSQLGLEGRLVIGAVGRFFWIKNQEGLIRAFAALADDVPEATLLLVGSGNPESIRQLTRDLGVLDRVRISPFQQEIPQVLAAIDLFVQPALAESFGLVLVEAMAMRKPVVSTSVGIAPDLLDDGRAGSLTAAATPESLERAIRRLLAERKHWDQMGAVGRELVERFTPEAMARRYQDLYEGLTRDDLSTET